VLFSLNGKKTAQIKVSNTDTSRAVEATSFKAGADSNSFIKTN